MRIMLSTSVSTRSLYHAEKPARQFFDVIFPPPADGFPRNQFAPDSECRGAGENEIGCRLLVHATGGNQAYLGQRHFKRPDVLVTTGGGTGKYLDEVSSSLPCLDYFRWRQRAGEHYDISLRRKFEHFNNKSWACQEHRARIETPLRSLRIQYGSAANDHVGKVPDELGNDIDRAGYGHRDLGDRNSRPADGLRRKKRVIGRTYPDTGDNTYLLDTLADFGFCHSLVLSLFGAG
jgi:hypothetical protein